MASPTIHNLGDMKPMVANQPEFVDENCWFPDSRAMNHVTNDLGNLSISSEDISNGKIHMRNAARLHVSHIGHNFFNSNSCVLYLKNLLHVPLITKDLLYLSQFCVDNNVLLNFILILVLLRI